MLISWNWLAQYVRLDMAVEALTQRLALTGLNHESTDEVGGDLAIDLEVTSNRPDCLCHLGVAREVAVVFGKTMHEPDPRPLERGASIESATSVVVEAPDLCPRFTARVVSGCKIGESPWWLRKRLETLGVRPISNVVDVTNYVMFECGQPLHAYDLAKLAGRRLIVRRARGGEKLTAINNKVYELSPEMLAIADAERPVGLAGVMGGLESEIHPGTTDVLIEAAQFDAMSVRKTARALGLHSPSSYRFERGLDPERTEWASRRCAELVLETAGGVLSTSLIDANSERPPRPPITLRLDQIPRVLGIDVNRATAARILSALGLSRQGESATTLTLLAPSWRPDLEREIDLIEEVARIHGYQEIPEDRPVPLIRSARGRRERVEAEIRGVLVGLGLDEAYTFSLVSESIGRSILEESGASSLRVDHSSRKLENSLRQSLSLSLLSARAYNEAHGNDDAELFEIANVYLPKVGKHLPDEPAHLAIVSGRDLLGLKGVVETLLQRLHLDGELTARPASAPLFVPGRAAELLLGNVSLGLCGEISQDVRGELSLRNPCSGAELSLDLLIERAVLVPQHRALPPFPSVARDLSLVVSKSLPWSELAVAARKTAGPTLEGLSYFDAFAGADIPSDQHSLHFGLRFRHPNRTLTSEEVDNAVQAVVDDCRARFGATLRS
jgi:phenylalanyl-tRNA synthetase beta chain